MSMAIVNHCEISSADTGKFDANSQVHIPGQAHLFGEPMRSRVHPDSNGERARIRSPCADKPINYHLHHLGTGLLHLLLGKGSTAQPFLPTDSWLEVRQGDLLLIP